MNLLKPVTVVALTGLLGLLTACGGGGDAAADATSSGQVGLTISNATVTSLNKTYTFTLTNFGDNAGKTGLNGGSPNEGPTYELEMDVSVDTATGNILRVAVWNYKTTEGGPAPDHFYGCDNAVTGLACTGIVVDKANSKVTVDNVVWKEVDGNFSGNFAPVVSGGTITVTGSVAFAAAAK